MWEFRGQVRPGFAIEPGPGQESVWDYPRPPIAQPVERLVEVRSRGAQIAHSTRAWRLLETASPPTWYVPPHAVDFSQLVDAPGRSVCEWKGQAQYWALAHEPDRIVGWSYTQPREPYTMLRDHLSFYPGRVACFVDGERVGAQPGGFYGGWVTAEIVGPFKGEPGTGHW